MRDSRQYIKLIQLQLQWICCRGQRTPTVTTRCRRLVLKPVSVSRTHHELCWQVKKRKSRWLCFMTFPRAPSFVRWVSGSSTDRPTLSVISRSSWWCHKWHGQSTARTSRRNLTKRCRLTGYSECASFAEPGFSVNGSRSVLTEPSPLKRLLQLRFDCDSTSIRLRFDYDSTTTIAIKITIRLWFDFDSTRRSAHVNEGINSYQTTF